MSFALRESPALRRAGQPRRSDEPHPEEGKSLGLRRALGVVAAVGLFQPTFNAWSDAVRVPSGAIVAVALAAGLLWLIWAMATASDESRLDRLEVWLLAVALLVLAAWIATQLNLYTGYGTDEAAFEQGAATLLLHGHDPYGANLLPALANFSTPAKYATYTMSGSMVSTLGYPALPVLVVAPLVALTNGGQAVPLADVLVLMVAMVIVFKQLPRRWRSLAVILCVGLPILSGYAVAGVNAIMVMTLLLVAAYRWTSTGESGSLVSGDRVRAIALGLALATNQLAWFAAPFLVAGIYLVRHASLGVRGARRVTLSYLALAAGAFTAINLPFILWGPSAWLHGVTAPLTQHAIPYGQGLIDFTLFLRIGGGALDSYNYAAALLYLALLVVYVAEFRKLGRACFVLPVIALFVSGRSLAEYWMTLCAVLALSIITAEQSVISAVRPLRLGPPSGWRRRLTLAALFAPAAVCLAVALGTPQPLTMRILSARSSQTQRTVEQLRVLVHNGSDQPLAPHFATNVTGQAVPWSTARGPSALAPHASAVYVLRQSDPSSSPPNGAPFLLEAVTPSPRTISSTGQFTQPGPVPGSW